MTSGLVRKPGHLKAQCVCIPGSGVLKFSVTARGIAARRRPLPPSPSVCPTSIRRRTRRNPRPCVWTADSRLTSAYLTLCGITWETILPISDGTCCKWLYCRLGGDPSLPRSSDYIASYIPTGLLQQLYRNPDHMKTNVGTDLSLFITLSSFCTSNSQFLYILYCVHVWRYGWLVLTDYDPI